MATKFKKPGYQQPDHHDTGPGDDTFSQHFHPEYLNSALKTETPKPDSGPQPSHRVQSSAARALKGLVLGNQCLVSMSHCYWEVFISIKTTGTVPCAICERQLSLRLLRCDTGRPSGQRQPPVRAPSLVAAEAHRSTRDQSISGPRSWGHHDEATQ